ncbi:MAG: fatty acid metabolism transcriptional regulator FadR [Candidatus Promineofilum sp.]|nr:fatty acid metabolism transcriptional regulator FadR [Promineifilum sp.]
MNSKSTPVRPNERAESWLVAAILDGDLPPGSTLPAERSLAAQLGITRPTLREAIQRLARDGWLTVTHGKPTVINDYWVEGGLNVLGKLVEHQTHLSPDFIEQLLEVRRNLAPAYTSLAVARAPGQVIAVLEAAPARDDDPAAFARFDWLLHRQLSILSGNPIYTLILNGFQGFYEDIARGYFQKSGARALSADFYSDLERLTRKQDSQAAEALCRQVMSSSIGVWQGLDPRDVNKGE